MLVTLGIDYDSTGEGTVFRLGTINLPFYYSTEVFLRDFKIQDVNRDFGIINEYLFYQHTNNIFYKNGLRDNENNIIVETIAYLNIKQLLTDTIIPNAFANYIDNARRRIIIISAVKGTMLIGFPSIAPVITNGSKLNELFEKLNLSLKAKGFTSFFKSEVYEQLKNINEENRFICLVENLLLILENAERNFEVYLSNFSFNELKDKLTLERVKYFNTSKEILSKVYVQITSIPIAISAAAFATYKVDNRFTLILIFLTFFVYAIFVLRLLFLLKNEINLLKLDFDID